MVVSTVDRTSPDCQGTGVTQASDAFEADANDSRKPRLVGNNQQRAHHKYAAEIDYSGRKLDLNAGHVPAPSLGSESDYYEQQSEQCRSCRRSNDVKVGPLFKPQLLPCHASLNPTLLDARTIWLDCLAERVESAIFGYNHTDFGHFVPPSRSMRDRGFHLVVAYLNTRLIHNDKRRVVARPAAAVEI